MALIAPTLPDSCVSMILARLPPEQVPKHLPKKMIRDVALEALRNMPTPSQDETPKAFVARLIQSKSPLLRLDAPLGAHEDLREVQAKIEQLTHQEIENFLLPEEKEPRNSNRFYDKVHDLCTRLNDELVEQYGQLIKHWLSFLEDSRLTAAMKGVSSCKQQLRELMIETLLKKESYFVYTAPDFNFYSNSFSVDCNLLIKVVKKVVRKFPNKKIQLNIKKVSLTTFHQLTTSLDPAKVHINLGHDAIHVGVNAVHHFIGVCIFLILVYGALGFAWYTAYFKAHLVFCIFFEEGAVFSIGALPIFTTIMLPGILIFSVDETLIKRIDMWIQSDQAERAIDHHLQRGHLQQSASLIKA